MRCADTAPGPDSERPLSKPGRQQARDLGKRLGTVGATTLLVVAGECVVGGSIAAERGRHEGARQQLGATERRVDALARERVEEVGRICGAGTDCGGCQGAIEDLLEREAPSVSSCERRHLSVIRAA